jgi:hypothetical protein
MNFDSIEFALDHEAMGQSYVQFCPTIFLEYIFTSLPRIRLPL